MEEDSALKLCNTEGGLHHKGLWRPLWVYSSCTGLSFILGMQYGIVLHLRSLFVAKVLRYWLLKVSWSNEVLNWLLYFILLIVLWWETLDAGHSGNSWRNKKYAHCLVFWPLTLSFSQPFALALVFSYDFHAGAETMFSRHFNDPAADSYFTKRKWGEFVLPTFFPHPAEINSSSPLMPTPPTRLSHF